MHISVTGLKPKGLMGFFKLWRLAIPSFEQAKTAKYNLFCEVRRINVYQYSLTACEDKTVMCEFMKSGVHLKDMKSLHKIATGKTYRFESDAIPTWKEAFEQFDKHGKTY